MTTSVDETVKALSVLENIEVAQKLSFKGGEITRVENPSRITRWLSGDGKEKTLVEIEKIIESAIGYNIPIYEKVNQSLENLKVTYHKSKTMMLRLTEIQRRITKYMHERNYSSETMYKEN
jgi:hypothetical protein